MKNVVGFTYFYLKKKKSSVLNVNIDISSDEMLSETQMNYQYLSSNIFYFMEKNL